MSLHAFNAGANVVAYEKDGIEYAMVCAWAMMIDYNGVAMLLGGQSVTGNNLKVGDEVGISALAAGQSPIAKALGSSHSNEVRKLDGIPHRKEGDAILIEGARNNMVARVRSIEDREGDHLVFFEIVSSKENKDVAFLDGYDPNNY